MEMGERVLAATFEELLPHLDERRRLVLGAEARWLGHGLPEANCTVVRIGGYLEPSLSTPHLTGCLRR